MYRQGLGDCFLLAFPSPGNDAVYMLIDCGILKGTPDERGIMARVAKDIRCTAGERLDVVVPTHEHYDHLSGFLYPECQEEFDGMAFGQVWAAWTEDAADSLAKKLKKEHAAKTKLVQALACGLRGAGKSESADAIERQLSAAKSAGVGLEYVLGRVSSPKFKRPGGRPISLPGTKNVRVYVLGPPEDNTYLNKLESDALGVLYPRAHGKSGQEGRLGWEVLAMSDPRYQTALSDERDLVEMGFPFDKTLRLGPEDERIRDFINDHYNGPSTSPQRQISSSVVGMENELALRLANKTNNTSLALAIELVESRKVLLFPGDAQLGNMLSWHNLSWTVGGEKVTVKDLLGHTVLYKVGHHGSHNATLCNQGLEMMNGSELVAMLPVDEKMAYGQTPNPWPMPLPSMFKRLRTKTRERIIRSDQKIPGEQPSNTASAKEWKAFRRATFESPDGLCTDYTIEG